jgi:hypothetical protein
VISSTRIRENTDRQALKPVARSSAKRRGHRWLDILTTRFDDPLKAHDLLKEFLRHSSYNRNLLLKLLTIAAGSGGDSWEIRRLSILMLEHQVLKIAPEDIKEFDLLLIRLKLKTELSSQVNDSVLREGFSTTDLLAFTLELRRKLNRLHRVHSQIHGTRTTRKALTEFVELSRSECKLSLARYLFQPNEVVDRIIRQVKSSKGLMDLDIFEPASVAREDEYAIARMPAYESRILELLRQTHHIYWVSDLTGSELNSLVEYPLTTVVLVIKPPGSNLEFEIKRAGRRRDRPLSVVHSRNGEAVPPSHRLDGGSTQWLLRYESKSVSRLASIYRLVHGTEAPFPTFHSRSAVYNVPVDGTVEDILNYFTKPDVFGIEYREMRVAMKEANSSFDDEHQAKPFEIPGDLGLTMQFLGHVSPTQAIISGTSSFRLDRLAAYLSTDGPQTYFEKGLQAVHSELDERRLADEVLEEVLGVYQPSADRYRSYEQYLSAAFDIAANRARADHNFLIAMEQIGKFWGTLLALRGNTNGESFVPRNVGLRSVWENGQWQIKVIFMDHDNLNLADVNVETLQSLGAHAGTALDELYIWGIYDGVRHVVGAVDCLETIYRTTKEVSRQGSDRLRGAVAKAYKKTHSELAKNSLLGEFFNPSFVDRIRDWDSIAASFLQIKDEPGRLELWKEEMLKTFVQNGCDKNVILEHLITTERFGKFLERYAFLY